MSGEGFLSTTETKSYIRVGAAVGQEMRMGVGAGSAVGVFSLYVRGVRTSPTTAAMSYNRVEAPMDLGVEAGAAARAKRPANTQAATRKRLFLPTECEVRRGDSSLL